MTDAFDDLDGVVTTLPNVWESHDYGRKVYDTTVPASTIYRLWKQGLLRIDDEHQRGINSVTGKQIVKPDKVDRWAEQLVRDAAVFGQLTWNFRPEENDLRHDSENRRLAVSGEGATLPDSAHRHRAIVKAYESREHGSSFDPKMRFSVRIWNVPAEIEDEIFYGMNQEGDKADATRSKFLSQRNNAQRLARELVRASHHLTEDNVETVVNTLSAKNPRLAAFNTFATAFENSWGDLDTGEVADAVEFLVRFWDRLVSVRSELGVLSLPERRRARQELVSGSALAIHGYVALARRFRDQELGPDALDGLAGTIELEDGTEIDFMSFANPVWQERGVLVPASNKTGGLNIRNAIQTRRTITEIFADRVGLGSGTRMAEAAV